MPADIPRDPGASRARGAGLVLLLCLVGLLRWHADLFWPETHLDEETYMEAARALAAGDSPYQAPRFVYNPPFAWVTAQGISQLGEVGTLVAWRLAGLLGIAYVLWLSLEGLSWSRPARLAAGTVLMVASPIVSNNMLFGNVSFVFIGLSFFGLRWVARRPLLAGIPLGLAIGLKPMTATAVPLLAAWREPGAARRGGWLAAGSAGVAALALQGLGWQYLADLWEHAGGLPAMSHNIALSRVLYCFGLVVPPVSILAAVTVAGTVWVWRRPMACHELVAVAGTLSALALPSVSLHTLALTLPAQCLALERGLRGRREASDAARRRRASLHLALVGVGWVAIHGAHGAGTLGAWPLPAQGVFMALPVLAPLALTWYGLGRGEAFRASSG